VTVESSRPRRPRCRQCPVSHHPCGRHRQGPGTGRYVLSGYPGLPALPVWRHEG
jgi:hypothetical protein